MARVTRNLPVRACKEVKIQSALHKTSSPFSDGFARFRNFALGFLLLGAIGIYAYPKIFNSVNSKLAGVIEEKLNVQLEKVGLVGSVAKGSKSQGWN